ncbi:hypothetical protein [Mycolicibacterium sp. P1-18]|uniref:hypothetical protein n=1 Tax=Mycolicibacterium sp. P1-18 TaxID=2024615 RepID=UPI0018D8EF28|nr:hypothetical protein [Mycolicibacterium sp. P1-18]
MTFSPDAACEELPPPVAGAGSSFFFVHPPVTIAMANATLITPTKRWETGIDSSFGVGLKTSPETDPGRRTPGACVSYIELSVE